MKRLFQILFALGFVSVGSLGLADETNIRIETEQLARSIHAEIPTEIEFISAASAPVKIFWLNYAGMRKHYYDLAPGETLVQQTYLTHPWVVESDAGEVLGIYYPDAQLRTIVVEPK